MRSVLNDLKIPLLSLLLIGLLAAFFMPPTPIDETRYLSVAWEMYNTNSNVVPLLNGEPYAHKPPFLFWMLQAGWKLFGVNDVTPRLTFCLFGMLSILLLHKISLRLWPEDKKTATYAALVMGSTLLWMIWSCAIMFDVMITFWVLISILGILVANTAPKKGWILLTLGIAGGMLTKGPVIMVYTLPLVLLRPLWTTNRSTSWKILSAFIVGIGLAMLWAIPAAILGGEEYRNAIFWGQTVNRIESSFAHHRPIWWYIPVLPLIFFPWLFFKPSLAKINIKKTDGETRLILLWIAAPFVIFSLISCKQIHYLIPLIPAGALLMGRNITHSTKVAKPAAVKIVGAIYILASLSALVLPFINFGKKIGTLAPGSTWIIAAGLLTAGLLLMLPFQTTDDAAKGLALSTVLILLFGLIEAKKCFGENYNLKGMAVAIKCKMDEGRPVAHIGKYYAQYQFIGRLTKPITCVNSENDSDNVSKFIAENPNGVLISCLRKNKTVPENSIIYYKQRYRGKESIVLWGPCHQHTEGCSP